MTTFLGKDLRKSDMLISIVFPMYNEQENVKPLFDRMSKVLATIKEEEEYEIIVINNGSSDNTYEELIKILEASKGGGTGFSEWDIKILTFTRNFGYDNAILTGLEHANGNYIFVMDGDLQDPPEEIPRFLDKVREGYEIVYGLRNKRTESRLIKIFISIFYYWWSRINKYEFPKNAGNFCVITKKVADNINSLRETSKYFRGVRAWLGYNAVGLEYERVERERGVSKFSFISYLNYGIVGITAFSTTPIRMLTISGIIGILISIFGFLVILFQKLFIVFFPSVLNYDIAAGWTSIGLLIMVSISINLLGLGLLGEYIARIFEEIKARPKAILERIDKNF